MQFQFPCDLWHLIDKPVLIDWLIDVWSHSSKDLLVVCHYCHLGSGWSICSGAGQAVIYTGDWVTESDTGMTIHPHPHSDILKLVPIPIPSPQYISPSPLHPHYIYPHPHSVPTPVILIPASYPQYTWLCTNSIYLYTFKTLQYYNSTLLLRHNLNDWMTEWLANDQLIGLYDGCVEGIMNYGSMELSWAMFNVPPSSMDKLLLLPRYYWPQFPNSHGITT